MVPQFWKNFEEVWIFFRLFYFYLIVMISVLFFRDNLIFYTTQQICFLPSVNLFKYLLRLLDLTQVAHNEFSKNTSFKIF